MVVEVFDAIAVKDSVAVGSGSAAKPSITFGDGDTGIYKNSDDELLIKLCGSIRWFLNSGTLGASCSSRAVFKNIDPTNTSPNIIPAQSDSNTGIGWASEDNLSLIAGGLEGARIEDPADCSATETSLFLYDKDNDTLEKVTVGAANSGGAGFKVLRIPN